MNIVLIGSGGHAKVIIDIVQREKKHTIVGLIDQQQPIEEEVNGGGACGANIDPNAPVSSGHIAMLLTPLLFIGFRKILGNSHYSPFRTLGQDRTDLFKK